MSQDDDGIDGFIRLSSGRTAPVSGCSSMESSTLYVQPRHHGMGIGKALLDAALDHCRELGTESVWLTTNAGNSPAIAFDLRRGFDHVGETQFRIGREGYLNSVYSLRLT